MRKEMQMGIEEKLRSSIEIVLGDLVRAGTLAADTDPYALASTITAALEGALMLSRLYDDPAHMDRVVDHLVAHVASLRVKDGQL